MKNNLLKIIILFFLFFTKVSSAEQYRFETSEIEIIDNGNVINASNGSATSNDGDIQIDANKFIYLKNSNLLKAFNGIAFIKSDNLKIEFDKLELDNLNSILTASGNNKIYDLENEISIKTDLIIFDRNSNIIKSPNESILSDKLNNIFDSQSFEYDINRDILKVKNANFKDVENNNFFVELAYINTLTNKLFGKDVAVDLNNKSFNKDNDPRLKGKSVSFEKGNTEIKKGIFTTCKKNDKCPPWQLSAEKIQHNKKTQTINYKNAWLKIYDMPVAYFPKFFHPDPTVKRKSGFLIPTIKNSPNSANFLNLPYFHVISSNKDLTFTPRLYTDDKILIQSEYREENKNSSHIGDVSFFKEKSGTSKNHLFYKFKKNVNLFNFEDSDINLQIEKVSNDTYLKAHKLESPLINSYDVMETYLSLELSEPELSINTDFIIYESLDKNKTDRYEFILPKIDLVKKVENNTNLDGEFLFKSSNLIKNYQTNIFEKVNINNFIFNSSPVISDNGLYNNYDFIFKNVNSDSQKSKNYKQDKNFYLASLIQFNSSLPLVKDYKNLQNIVTPKISLKLSPSHTNDLRESTNRIDVNNVFNLDRLSSNNTLESGASLTYGNDFLILDKENSREILSLKIANNLRFDENKDLPNNNQIGQKTSNFFGEVSYSPNEFLTTKYNTTVKNNLKDVNYENFGTEITLNNLVTTFDYLNENNTSDEVSYLTNTTKYKIDETNNLLFSTRRNKKTDLTEYYNLMYQYKNDCLSASIEYNKDYYEDSEIKPEESIFFKLTIIPFGETSSPDLKN